jgi:hypothetical protein
VLETTDQISSLIFSVLCGSIYKAAPWAISIKTVIAEHTTGAHHNHASKIGIPNHSAILGYIKHNV